MSLEVSVSLWLVRLALFCYAAAFAIRLIGSSNSVARILWTTGFCFLVLHVLAVFAVYHHWSHDEALAHTARRTAELTGWNWGGGLYFNYAFLALWAGDLLWWWGRPESYHRRSAWIEGMIQGYLAFIAVNATIIFGQGAVRWGGIGILILLVFLAMRRYRRSTHRN